MTGGRVRRALAALALVGGALIAPPAAAQSTPAPARDEASRTAAKVLGEAGVELFQKGDYEGALEKFRQAQNLANVPTLGLRVARCLDKLGRLFEARRAYEETAALALEPGAPAAQKAAQEQAATELTALNARIPTLSIVVQGADASGVEVAVDGQRVPAAELAKRSVEPGGHRVEGRRGDEKVVVETTAAEGQSVQVVLVFAAASAGGAPGPVAPPPPPGDAAPGGSRRILAYSALGLGAVGLGVGAVTGGLALGKQSTLDAACPEDRCPATYQGMIKNYDVLRAFSMIGFGVGVLAAGAGVTLLLTAPSAPAPPAAAGARIEPWIGVGSAGARGSF